MGPDLATCAREFLIAVATGREVNIAAIAEAVLDSPLVALARQVTEGGPHAMRRAIELAALVASAPASTAERVA